MTVVVRKFDKKIADAGARRRRHRAHIGARNGLGDRAIELVVDLVDAPIPRFPRILGSRLCIGRQRDAARQGGGQTAPSTQRALLTLRISNLSLTLRVRPTIHYCAESAGQRGQ